MGYQTVFMVLNDGASEVKNHPEEVANNIYEAMIGVGMYRKNSRSFSIGNFANPMKAFSSQHADTPQLLLAHQNDLIRFGYASDLTEERLLEYRKRSLKIAKEILKQEEREIKELEAKLKTS